MMASFNKIQSKDHNITVAQVCKTFLLYYFSNANYLFVLQNKLALSPFDDKHHIRSDGFHTYAHGHFRITLEDVQEIDDDQ